MTAQAQSENPTFSYGFYVVDEGAMNTVVSGPFVSQREAEDNRLDWVHGADFAIWERCGNGLFERAS